MVNEAFTKEKIEFFFKELNNKLKGMEIKGEVIVYGGAAIVLTFNERLSTEDVDGVFEPAFDIRRASMEVAKAYHLRPEWLNDAVKIWLSEYGKRELFKEYSNLRIFVADPKYLLAMKALAARFDTYDLDDIKLLIKKLDIRSPDDVFNIIRGYYPEKEIKTVTRRFIKGLFDDNG